MSAVFAPGHRAAVPTERAVWVAVVTSLVLHTLLLFGFSFLARPSTKFVSQGPIIARLVEPRDEQASAAAERPAAKAEPDPPSRARAQQDKPLVKAPSVPSPPPEAAREPKPAPREAEAPPVAAQQPSAPPSATLAPSPPPTAPAASAPAAAVAEPLARADPQPGRAAPPPAVRETSRLDAGTVERYRLDVINAAMRYRTNPRVPGMRDIKETTAVVRMVIGENGNIASISVQKSAGHEVLDRNSIETMRKAKPLVQIPPALRGKEFTIEVPFIYQLRDEGA